MLSLVLWAALTTPPATPTEDLLETRFGIAVADPYRWLENADDPRREPWVAAQRRHAEEATAGALRDEIEADLNAAARGRDRPARDEIDGAFGRFRRIPAGGHGFQANQAASASGKYEIVLTTDTRSDLKLLRVKDSASGAYLADALQVKFAQTLWDADEKAFLYVSDRDGRTAGQLSYVARHVLGTLQTEDTVLFKADDATTGLALMRLDDGKMLLWQEAGATSHVAAFDPATGATTPYPYTLTLPFQLFGVADGRLLLANWSQDPRGSVDQLELATGAMTTILPAREQALDLAYRSVQGEIFLAYVDAAAHRLFRYDPATKQEAEIALPGVGSVDLADGDDGKLVVAYSSYAERVSEWTYDRASGKLVLKTAADPTPFPLTAERKDYRLADGTTAPLWIVRRDGIALTPETPVYLYGYGGFALNILPWFRTNDLPWLQRGGVVAIATLPGGRERGEDWHHAGWRGNKRAVFDAFAAAGRSLIEGGMTSPAHLGIGGRSNGGLLAAETASLYPELFAATVPECGVLDLTRFQLFTGGKYWIDEYGDRDVRADYVNQLALSPYHALTAAGAYPAALVITADQDDRVVPAHSYKFAARLQAVTGSGRQALLWTKTGGSHSSASGLKSEKIREVAMRWAFLWQNLAK